MDPTKILFTDNKTEITHVYHISDIFIKNNERFNEYAEILDILTNILKYKPKNSILVITGNIFQDHNEMNVSSLELVTKLLNINSFMPIILTPGWYDFDPSVKHIPCILKTMTRIKRENGEHIYYIDKTGTYQYQNILFNLSSVCDGDLIMVKKDGLMKNIKQKNKYYIGLAHHEPNIKSNKNSIRSFPDKFEDTDFDDFCKYCDYVMLGGCNKYKKITKNIAYAGSLIQQSFDDDIKNHGILEWNLTTGETELIPVKNNYGYCTLNVNDTIDISIPKNAHIILKLDKKSHNDIINYISKRHDLPNLKNKNIQTITFDIV